MESLDTNPVANPDNLNPAELAVHLKHQRLMDMLEACRLGSVKYKSSLALLKTNLPNWKWIETCMFTIVGVVNTYRYDQLGLIMAEAFQARTAELVASRDELQTRLTPMSDACNRLTVFLSQTEAVSPCVGHPDWVKSEIADVAIAEIKRLRALMRDFVDSADTKTEREREYPVLSKLGEVAAKFFGQKTS